MPQTDIGVLLFIGAIFFLIGLLGGGFEISAIKIPPVGKYPRYFSLGIGILFMGIAVVRLLFPPAPFQTGVTPTSTTPAATVAVAEATPTEPVQQSEPTETPITLKPSDTPVPKPTNTPKPTPTPPATMIPGKLITSEDFENYTVIDSPVSFDEGWEIVKDETGNKVLECNNVSLEKDTGGVLYERTLKDFILDYRIRLIRYSNAYWGQGLMQVNIREIPGKRYVIAFAPSGQSFGIFYQGEDTNDRWVDPGGQKNVIGWVTSEETWMTVRAEVKGAKFILWLDGKKVIEIDDDKVEKGRITFGIGPNTFAQFDDIRIWEVAP